MVSELTKWFYRRNPSLASTMIGWGVLEFAQTLIIALAIITLTSDMELLGAWLVEWWILLFLLNFKKSLKQLVVVSLEPQNLRIRICNILELKKRTEKELKLWHKCSSIAIGVLNVTYCICILASKSFGERLGWTMNFLLAFEFYFLARTEIEKLIKK